MPPSITIGSPTTIWQEAVREPALFQLDSGDILLTAHMQADTHFALRQGLRSRDGGKTWQHEPGRAHREQAMGQHGQTVLAMDIYTFERTPSQFVGSYFRSDDGGQSFHGPYETVVHMNRVDAHAYPEPENFPEDDHVLRHFYQPLPAYYRPIVQGSSNRKGPVFWRYLIHHSGRWITPMYGKWHGDRNYRTMLVESRDDGKTWQCMSTVAYDHEDPSDGYCEPVMIALPDDTLLCVIRRGGHHPLGLTRSSDGGRTWSKPEHLKAHGVDPDLCLMHNGLLACVSGRPGRIITVSEDLGRTWAEPVSIGDWPGSSYMGICDVSDKTEPDTLLCVHDIAGERRREDQCAIRQSYIRVKR